MCPRQKKVPFIPAERTVRTYTESAHQLLNIREGQQFVEPVHSGGGVEQKLK